MVLLVQDNDTSRKYVKRVKPILFLWSQKYSPKVLNPSPR